MLRPYEKHDLFSDRDRSPSERMGSALGALKVAKDCIERFEATLRHLPNYTSDGILQTLCDAAESVRNAAQNAAYLGKSDYEVKPVESVGYYRNWIEETLQKRFELAPIFCGKEDGKEYFWLIFEDGTEGKYWIDWNKGTIKPVDGEAPLVAASINRP